MSGIGRRGSVCRCQRYAPRSYSKSGLTHTETHTGNKLYPRKWTRDFDPWPRSADTHLTHRVRSAAPVLRKGRSRHSYHLFPDWNLVGNDCNHGSHHRAPCPLRQRRRAKHGSLCRRCNNPRRRNLWRPLLPHFEHHHSLLLGCRIGPHCTCKNTASLCSNLCCNWLHRVFDYWPHTVILCSTKCTAVLIEPPYK